MKWFRSQRSGFPSLAFVAVLTVVACWGCGSEPASESPAESAAISVRASVDRAEVSSSDRVRLTIEVDYDATFEVEPLDVGDDLGGMEVLERGRNVLRTVRGRTGLIDWFVLRPPTPGSYVVEPFDVVAVGPDGDEVQQATNEVFVEVATRLAAGDDAEGLRGLKPPVEPAPVWPWLVGGVVFAGLLGVLWWWRTRRMREVPEVVLAPHELAFAELEALRSTDFTDLFELRRYYYELSAVLRRYVEGRFGLNATDLTSQEIRSRLAEVGLQRVHEEKLDRFFFATDGVKYAAQVPSEEAVESVYETALSFVEETVPDPDAGEEKLSPSGVGDGAAEELERSGDASPAQVPADGEAGGEAARESDDSGDDDPHARYRP